MTEHSCPWKLAESIELQPLLTAHKLRSLNLKESARRVGITALIPTGVWAVSPRFLFDPACARHTLESRSFYGPAYYSKDVVPATLAAQLTMVNAIDNFYANVLQACVELPEHYREPRYLAKPKGLYIPQSAIPRFGLSHAVARELKITRRTDMPEAAWLATTESKDYNSLVDQQLWVLPGGQEAVRSVHANLSEPSQRLFERTHVKLATYEPSLPVIDIIG